MNKGLRILGTAGAALTIALVGLDLQRHAAASASLGASLESPPPGFRQRLRGLGWTEISFKGHVEMEAENRFPQADGSTLSVPSYKVVGSDPIPLGEGMQLIDANIHSLKSEHSAATSRTAFSVSSPHAWIPLEQNQRRFAFDMQRLWQLENPVFKMPDFHQGRPLHIETEHADLDPKTDQVFGRGSFLLISGDLRLEGADIFFDPASSRVEFQPLNGLLRWSIRNHDGAVFHGSCDGPGSFYPAEDGGYRLEFHAVEEVASIFPTDSSMPGVLITRDMTLLLLPAGDGSWRPTFANANGPTDWQGESLQMQGSSSSVEWNEQGILEHLTVQGPVEVRPQDDSFDWASANGLARFNPKSKTVRLEDTVMAKHARGVLNGDWAELGPTQWKIGGSVMALGNDGLALGQLLETDRKGNWLLRGAAEIHPDAGQIDWIRSPEIHFNERGRVFTDSGFSLQATVDDFPLLASGQHLDSRMQSGRSSNDPLVRRTNASGNLLLEHQGRKLRGEKLEQLGDRAFRLLGNASTGKRITGEATLGEVPVELNCGRLSWDGAEVAIEGAPWIKIPAASLGLAGDKVVLHARRILQHAKENSWELRENVVCEGALVGAGTKATWTPGVAMIFEAKGRDAKGQPLRAHLQGRMQDGRVFVAQGARLSYAEEGLLSLEDKAYLSLLQNRETQPAELWGDKIELGKLSGWAIGHARFQSKEARGSAQRIDWTRYPNAGDLLVLMGDAELQGKKVTAAAPHLEVDTRVDTITCIGADNLPATLRTDDGRTAAGDWLRYYINSGRFESHGARFETP